MPCDLLKQFFGCVEKRAGGVCHLLSRVCCDQYSADSPATGYRDVVPTRVARWLPNASDKSPSLRRDVQLSLLKPIGDLLVVKFGTRT